MFKSRLSFLMIVLVFLGCENVRPPNEECSQNLDLDKILEAYEQSGKPIAEINFSKPLKREWIRNDFAMLRRILEESNPNIYRYHEKEVLDSLWENTFCALDDSIYYQDFTKYIARVFNTVACGHSGWMHCKDFMKFRSDSMKFFPIDIISNQDRYFIVRDNSLNSGVIKGTEIRSINGESPHILNQKLRSYMYRDGNSIPNAEAEISKYFRNAYSNFIANPDTFVLILKDRSGAEVEIQLPAQSKQSIDSIRKARYEKKEGIGKPLRFKVDTTFHTGTYTIKSFRNEYIQQNEQNFYSFTDSVFQEINKKKVENLIIDLRGNVGGWTANGKKLFSYFIEETMPYILKVECSCVDSFSFAPLLLSNQNILDSMKFKWNEDGLYEWMNYPNLEVRPSMENRFSGKTYILTDEETRSCSSVFSSMMKSHTNAIFIGKECGAAQCGSGGMVIVATLPYTGITVFSSTAKYTTNVNDHLNSRGVEVDYSIDLSLEKILDEKDHDMKYVYELIKNNG